jgi:hypothetical protein
MREQVELRYRVVEHVPMELETLAAVVSKFMLDYIPRLHTPKPKPWPEPVAQDTFIFETNTVNLTHEQHAIYGKDIPQQIADKGQKTTHYGLSLLFEHDAEKGLLGLVTEFERQDNGLRNRIGAKYGISLELRSAGVMSRGDIQRMMMALKMET